MKAYHYLKDVFQNTIASSYLISPSIRNKIYSLFGHRIKGKMMAGSFLGYGNGKLTLGKGSSCNYKCFFDLGADVIIGENCNISFQVTFINSSHENGPATRRAKGSVAKPIIVGDGCWIGANVTIMPGVNIGNGCIIGTGSLVTKDCLSNSIYLGSPATLYKQLD